MVGMVLVKGSECPANIPRTDFTRALVAMEVGDELAMNGRKRRGKACAVLASTWGKRLGRRYRTIKTGEHTFSVHRVE